MNEKELLDNALRHFRNGDGDSFFQLLHMDRRLLPLLPAEYRTTADSELREFLVRVTWEYRDPTTIPFLATALRDPADRVWKQAIDGLVTIGSPEAISVLRAAYDTAAKAGPFDERRDWLREAIEQCEAQMSRKLSRSLETG
jgi:HEAT repeat protein